MLPFVTIIVPVLNEEHHLVACVQSLLNDPYPRDRLELYIVDGGSTDGTPSIARELAAGHPFIKLLDNPKRRQSAAFNRVMHLAEEAEFLIRCDAHAEYPSNFISTTIKAALESGAPITVFVASARAKTCFQKAVAFAQTTPLGVGNSEYRLGDRSMWVEHGWHGCFQRSAVLAVNGYDESFSHNEDSELSLRLAATGYRTWLDKRLMVGYYPRATPTALLRQMWNYGNGRCRTVLKHRMRPKPRQLAPVVLVAATPILLLCAIWNWLALLPLAAYLLLIALGASYGAVKHKSPCILLAMIALPCMHFAWGAGFLRRFLFR